MKQRPVGPLVDALRGNGCEIRYVESEGCLPLEITAGGLQGGVIELDAKISWVLVNAGRSMFHQSCCLHHMQRHQLLLS